MPIALIKTTGELGRSYVKHYDARSPEYIKNPNSLSLLTEGPNSRRLVTCASQRLFKKKKNCEHPMHLLTDENKIGIKHVEIFEVGTHAH